MGLPLFQKSTSCLNGAEIIMGLCEKVVSSNSLHLMASFSG